MTTLIGCKLLTDWKPLEELLEVIHTDQAAEHLFEERFPGMLSAVFNGIRYLNFRVQVWPKKGSMLTPPLLSESSPSTSAPIPTGRRH